MRPLPAFLSGIVVTLVVLGAVAYAAIVAGAVPARADQRPSRLERWAAQTSLNATIRREMPAGANPLPADTANLMAGVALYRTNCITCHGTSDGRTTKIARGLYIRAPRFARSPALKRDAPGKIHWVVQHGIRWTAMPSFGSSLTDEQIWQLALFLKNLHALPPEAEQAWRAPLNRSGLTRERRPQHRTPSV